MHKTDVMSHTINVTDLADQNAVLRILSDIQHHGTSYALVQEGVEVAKVVPVKDEVFDPNGKISPEAAERRRETMKKIDEFAKKNAHLWNTDKNAAELVAENRR